MQMLTEWNGKLSSLNEVRPEERLIAAKRLTLIQMRNDTVSAPNATVLDNMRTVLFWLKKQDHENYINHVVSLLADAGKYIDELDDFFSLLDVLPESSYQRWIAEDQHQWVQSFFNPKRLKTIDFFHTLTHKPIAVLRFISQCGLAAVLFNIYKPEEQLDRIAKLSWSNLPEVWLAHSEPHHYLIQLKNFIYFQRFFTFSRCDLISMSADPESMGEKKMAELTNEEPCYLLFNSKIYIVDDTLNPKKLLLKKADPDLSIFPSIKDKKEPATKVQLNRLTSLTGYTHFSKVDAEMLEELNEEWSDIQWSEFRVSFIQLTQEICISYNIDLSFFLLFMINPSILQSTRQRLAESHSEASSMDEGPVSINGLETVLQEREDFKQQLDFIKPRPDLESISRAFFQQNPNLVNTPEKLTKIIQYFKKDTLELILLDSLKSQWLEPLNEPMFKAAMATLDMAQPSHLAYFEAIYSILSFSCSNSENFIDISEAIEITNWRFRKTKITFNNYLDEKKQNKQTSFSELMDILVAIQLFNRRHPNNTAENDIELKCAIEKGLHLYTITKTGEQITSGRRRKNIMDWFQKKIDTYALANTLEQIDATVSDNPRVSIKVVVSQTFLPPIALVHQNFVNTTNEEKELYFSL